MLTDPRSLRRTIGREGWCQRLLTELILDGPYPPWNTVRTPSALGVAFLASLDRRCFGTDGISGRDVDFVDEIDLPARHADEKGCAPDYTVFVDGRCWIIELKTEPGSHRPRQIPDYFERARHYHPDRDIDITYLTAGLRAPFEPETQPWERYCHIEWSEVADLIRGTWADAPDPRTAEVTGLLLEGIAHLSLPVAEWWDHLGYPADAPTASPATIEAPSTGEGAGDLAPPPDGDPFEAALELAGETLQDGKQRAVGMESGGLEALHELRLQLREALRADIQPGDAHTVEPWVWNAATSGGRAMTAAGAQTGFELRLSRY